MSITDSIHGINYDHGIKCYRCGGVAEFIEWDLRIEMESGEVTRVGEELVCEGCRSRRERVGLEEILYLSYWRIKEIVRKDIRDRVWRGRG